MRQVGEAAPEENGGNKKTWLRKSYLLNGP